MQLHEKFLHEINEIAPRMMLAAGVESPTKSASVFVAAREGDSAYSAGYVQWLEQRVIELDALCQQQAEMLYRNPELLPKGS